MRRISSRVREGITGYMFIGIWIIGFFIFTAYPIVYSFYLSLNDITITGTGIEATSVGWRNYSYAFVRDVQFSRLLVEFSRDVAIRTPIIVVFALVIALVLNRKLLLRGFFRTVYFLPVVIISGPVLNELISQQAFALADTEDLVFMIWMAYPVSFSAISSFFSVFDDMILILWHTGVQVLILLAALQKIDRQVYEAARIDGASPWESIWKITLPTIKNIVLIVAVYTIVMMGQSKVSQVNALIQTKMFQGGDLAGFGYSAALSYVYFVVIIVFLLIALGLFSIRKKAVQRGYRTLDQAESERWYQARYGGKKSRKKGAAR